MIELRIATDLLNYSKIAMETHFAQLPRAAIKASEFESDIAFESEDFMDIIHEFEEFQ